MTRRVKLKSKDAAALKEFLEGLRAALGNNLLETKLFGSKATGKDQPDSDIDVLVVVSQNGVEIEDRVLDIAFDVNLKHDVYISPRVIDRLHPLRSGLEHYPFSSSHHERRDFAVKRELEKLARHRLCRANEAFAESEHLLTKSAFMGALGSKKGTG